MTKPELETGQKFLILSQIRLEKLDLINAFQLRKHIQLPLTLFSGIFILQHQIEY